jgi:hypothetical protein
MLESIPAADDSATKKSSRQTFRLFPSFPVAAKGESAGAVGSPIHELPKLRDPLPNLAKSKDAPKRVPRLSQTKVVQFEKPLVKTTAANLAVDVNAPQPIRRRRWKMPDFQWDSPTQNATQASFSWKNFKQQTPWRMVGLTVVALGLMFWLSVATSKSNASQNAAASEPTSPPAGKLVKPVLTETEKQPKVELAKQILPVVTRFLEANDASALEPLVREPERVLPLMREYYNGGVQPAFTKANYHHLPEVKDIVADRDLVSVSLQTNDYKPYFLLLQQTPSGYKVDWECYVTYSEMPLAVFQEKKPTLGKLFRVKVEPIAYFNQDFPNANTHRAYRIYTADADRVLYGYVYRDTYVERQMVENIGKRHDITCIVRLNYPSPSSNNQQVEITQFVKRGWVLNSDDLKPQEVKVLPALSATTTTNNNSPAK